MKFDHVVKHNGIIYLAGAEVPVEEKAVLGDNALAGAFNDEPAGREWTKTEINRMAVEELRKLAAENGIENTEEISGADLKKLLIEKFGL